MATRSIRRPATRTASGDARPEKETRRARVYATPVDGATLAIEATKSPPSVTALASKVACLACPSSIRATLLYTVLSIDGATLAIALEAVTPAAGAPTSSTHARPRQESRPHDTASDPSSAASA